MERNKYWKFFVPFVCLFMLVFISCNSFAQSGRDGQNYTCETANPFCSGTQYAFPTAVNAGAGQSGPCYYCLVNTPNPAWYFMKVADPGNLIIEMHRVPARDIDFCCWGPFNTLDCCDELICSKVVSCDYGPSSFKTCTIPGGLTGQYYMFVITNISNLPGNIIFTQVGGTGTTARSVPVKPYSLMPRRL